MYVVIYIYIYICILVIYLYIYMYIYIYANLTLRVHTHSCAPLRHIIHTHPLQDIYVRVESITDISVTGDGVTDTIVSLVIE